MFRDKDKHLKRLEEELLAEETEKDDPVWEDENWEPEDVEDMEEEVLEEAQEEVPAGKKSMSRLMKLSITALCLLGGILLVLLYWLVRFF